MALETKFNNLNLNKDSILKKRCRYNDDNNNNCSYAHNSKNYMCSYVYNAELMQDEFIESITVPPKKRKNIFDQPIIHFKDPLTDQIIDPEIKLLMAPEIKSDIIKY